MSHALKHTSFLLALICFLSLASCIEKGNSEELSGINERIKMEYAPDKRVAIYDVKIVSDRNSIIPMRS